MSESVVSQRWTDTKRWITQNHTVYNSIEICPAYYPHKVVFSFVHFQWKVRPLPGDHWSAASTVQWKKVALYHALVSIQLKDRPSLWLTEWSWWANRNHSSWVRFLLGISWICSADYSPSKIGHRKQPRAVRLECLAVSWTLSLLSLFSQLKTKSIIWQIVVSL